MNRFHQPMQPGGLERSDIRSMSSISPICMCRCPPLAGIQYRQYLQSSHFHYSNNAWNADTVLQGTHAVFSAGILEQYMGTRNRVGIGLSSAPPGYIGWRNRFLGIDFWNPYQFKKYVPSLVSTASCLHSKKIRVQAVSMLQTPSKRSQCTIYLTLDSRVLQLTDGTGKDSSS